MTKKVVLAFGLEQTKIDPQFCDHQNSIHFIYPDGEYWVCPDCDSIIDEHGEVCHTAPDDIPIFEEDL
jgi:hypothetical protein